MGSINENRSALKQKPDTFYLSQLKEISDLFCVPFYGETGAVSIQLIMRTSPLTAIPEQESILVHIADRRNKQHSSHPVFCFGTVTSPLL